MKPVVIIVKEKDGKLDITKEELDKIIESAYQNGYDDGLKETFNPPPSYIIINEGDYFGIVITNLAPSL